MKKIISKTAIMTIITVIMLISPTEANAATDLHTFFVTGQRYDPRNCVPTVGAAVSVMTTDYEQALSNYIANGYKGVGELSSTHDLNNYYTGGLFDSQTHPDVVQAMSDGSKKLHQGWIGYVTPTKGFNNSINHFADSMINSGASYLVMEEPEIYNDCTYNDAFKAEWRSYYGTDWKDPQTDADTFLKASNLSAYLLQRQIDQVGGYVHGKYPEVKLYWAPHSPLNYFYFKAPFNYVEAMASPNCDGIIGQVWSNMIELYMLYEGKYVQRPFECGLFDYSYFAQLGKEYPSKDLLMLHDPKGDAWADKPYDYVFDRYAQQIVATLINPNVSNFHSVIWPGRIVGTDETGAPDYFKTVMSNVQGVLNSMHNYTTSNTSYNRPIRAGFLTSDTTAWQAGGPGNSSDPGSVYSIVLPEIHRGVLVDQIPMEGITSDADVLSEYDVIFLSYDIMKPQSSEYNEKLKDWVSNGGTLVYIGYDCSFDNTPSQWWAQDGYTSPEDDLMTRMGVTFGPRGQTTCTSATVNPESGSALAQQIGAFSGAGVLGCRMLVYANVSGEGVTPMYKVNGDLTAAFQKRLGAGNFVFFGIDPFYFGTSESGNAMMFKIYQSVASVLEAKTVTPKDYYEYDRGPYKGVYSINGTRTINGKFIDIFDDNLSILTSKNVYEGDTSLTLDVSNVNVTDSAKVVFATGNDPLIVETPNTTTVKAKGARNILGAVRILSKPGLMPSGLASAVDSTGKNVLYKQEWDSLNNSLLIKYWGDPDGVTVNMGWSQSETPAQIFPNVLDDRSGDIHYSGAWERQDDFRFIDDSNSGIQYAGAWNVWNDENDYNGSEHFTVSPWAYMEYEFTGTEIAWIGAKGPNYGYAKVTLDGVAQGPDIDLYSPYKSCGMTLFSRNDLSKGTHILRIECTGAKNSSSSGYVVQVDRFTGSWGNYENTETFSRTAGDYAEYTFTGKSIKWFAQKAPDGGMADVYIDGILDAADIDTYDSHLTPRRYDSLLYSKTFGDEGTHTIKIIAKGTKNPAAIDCGIPIDRLEYGSERKIIGLKSMANNMYVQAVNGGQDPLKAAASRIGGTWEQFEVIDQGNGLVALKSLANGLYVQSVNGGQDPLQAIATGVYGPWERFYWRNVGNRKIALVSEANNRYVQAVSGGLEPLKATATGIYGTWETFNSVLVGEKDE